MRQKEKLIEALLQCESVSQAAERAGVSRQHVHKLLRDPDFQKVLRRVRSQVHAHAMSRLCHLSGKAVTVLESALDGADVPKTKFLAARAVLDFAGQAVADDVESRLEEIEQQLERMDAGE